MSRTSRTITFSLPPEMADKMEDVTKEEGRTRSELLREALRRYIEEREWRQILRYGERKANEKSIAPEDVEDLVDKHRSESERRASRR
jgi:CopG family transcriptional regulator/antitoxin EndoAI